MGALGWEALRQWGEDDARIEQPVNKKAEVCADATQSISTLPVNVAVWKNFVLQFSVIIPLLD